jgi:formylglycine-generating enzyme required for sulfatase activity
MAMRSLLGSGLVGALAVTACDQSPAVQRDVEPVVAAQDRSDVQPGGTFQDCDACPEMVAIPGGSFLMGTAGDDTNQQRAVTIKAFAAGRFEVTWDEWEACVRAEACADNSAKGWSGKTVSGEYKDERGDAGRGRGRLPVVNVSWDDAQAYARWLSVQTDAHYRLLTEAEWEYAARAGATTPYYFGSDASDICRYANVEDQSRPPNPNRNIVACNDGFPTTAPVGSFMPNAFGLYDVHGNVAEWVEDCFVAYAHAPNDGSAVTSKSLPKGAPCFHGLRGGDYRICPYPVDHRMRRRANSVELDSSFGFRVARTL